ncbi:unnamed protein product [Tenebrio molitor]|nr:unnamed protein product [Tenebrio molitor]
MKFLIFLTFVLVSVTLVMPYCLPNGGLLPYQYVPLKSKLKAKLCAKLCGGGGGLPMETIWWA